MVHNLIELEKFVPNHTFCFGSNCSYHQCEVIKTNRGEEIYGGLDYSTGQ